MMLFNLDAVATCTMGIATFVTHIGDSRQNLLQAGKETVNTVILFLLLMHIIEALYLSIQLANVTFGGWNFVFLLNDIEEYLFQKCAAFVMALS